MRLHTALTRRRFLALLGWLGAVGLTRPLSGSAAESMPADPLIRKLASFYRHRESARAVGRAYLRDRPAERDVSTLAELVCSPVSGRRDELAAADRQTLRQVLLQQQRRDFEHGRTIAVEGWILSATEARLCALAALT